MYLCEKLITFDSYPFKIKSNVVIVAKITEQNLFGNLIKYCYCWNSFLTNFLENVLDNNTVLY